MKKQKGITLMALTIYVIVFMLVIGIVATLTSFFYNNVISFDETTKSYAEINKFNMYFLQDIKKNGVVVQNFIEEDDNEIGITLYNSKTYETNIYKFENNAIYRNGILVCRNIKIFSVNDEELENNKVITVHIETEGTANFSKTMKYSINS